MVIVFTKPNNCEKWDKYGNHFLVFHLINSVPPPDFPPRVVYLTGQNVGLQCSPKNDSNWGRDTSEARCASFNHPELLTLQLNHQNYLRAIVLFLWFGYRWISLWARASVRYHTTFKQNVHNWTSSNFSRMKPTRIRMCHSLVMNYGLYKKMEIFVRGVISSYS